MSGAVTKLAKPQLRGLLHSYVQRTFVVATVASIITGVAYQIFVRDRHAKRRERFYANYDADKDYERMKNLGLFRSVRPADESKAIYKLEWVQS